MNPPVPVPLQLRGFGRFQAKFWNIRFFCRRVPWCSVFRHALVADIYKTTGSELVDEESRFGGFQFHLQNHFVLLLFHEFIGIIQVGKQRKGW